MTASRRVSLFFRWHLFERSTFFGLQFLEWTERVPQNKCRNEVSRNQFLKRARELVKNIVSGASAESFVAIWSVQQQLSTNHCRGNIFPISTWDTYTYPRLKYFAILDLNNIMFHISIWDTYSIPDWIMKYFIFQSGIEHRYLFL